MKIFSRLLQLSLLLTISCGVYDGKQVDVTTSDLSTEVTFDYTTIDNYANEINERRHVKVSKSYQLQFIYNNR